VFYTRSTAPYALPAPCALPSRVQGPLVLKKMRYLIVGGKKRAGEDEVEKVNGDWACQYDTPQILSR